MTHGLHLLLTSHMLLNKHSSRELDKAIFDTWDLALFRRSEAFESLHLIILTLVNAVKGKDVPVGCLDPEIVTRTSKDPQNEPSPSKSPAEEAIDPVKMNFAPVNLAMLSVLTGLNQLVDETPPLTGPRRFGNMACRDWHSKLDLYLNGAFLDLRLSEDVCQELRFYLRESFGSKVRLDYGSGHELNFIAFVGGIYKQTGYLEKVNGEEVLVVFVKYYDLVRRLIIDYNLEPAGSHGVWGLDDHFHFIFILGAAQFNSPDGERADGSRIIPSVLQVLNPQTLDLYKTTNLYVNAIAFIFRIKLGPFNEHSPIIYDIHRSVSLWSKVLLGLQKMYAVEVLGKFPVVQHFYFGKKLYRWVDTQTHLPLSAGKIEGRADSDSEGSQETLPGMINGLQGTKTTTTNVSLTAAPWALKNKPDGEVRTNRHAAPLMRTRANAASTLQKRVFKGPENSQI